MTVRTELKVVVHYPAAEEPFKDDVDATETLGQLKTQVLKAFNLTEGQLPDGNSASYTFYHGKDPLENMGLTVGDVAGERKILQLNLSQQITQG